MAKSKLTPLNLVEAAAKAKAANAIEVSAQEGAQCRRFIEQAAEIVAPKASRAALTIEEAAALLGVSAQTLRNWETQGRIEPAGKTPKGHRRYTREQIQAIRKQQMNDLEILLPGVTPSAILDWVQKLLVNFDPLEEVNVTVRQDTILGKVRLTIDSADGLNSITKRFDIKE